MKNIHLFDKMINNLEKGSSTDLILFLQENLLGCQAERGLGFCFIKGSKFGDKLKNEFYEFNIKSNVEFKR